MKASIKLTLEKKGLTALKKKLKKLNNSSLEWGFFEAMHSKAGMSYAELATILEWGSIHIPGRPSFGSLVNTLQSSHIAYESEVHKAFNDFIEGDTSSPYKILQESGDHIVARHGDTMYNWLSSGSVNTSNAVETIRLKGFNMPLVETGELIESISYRVK